MMIFRIRLNILFSALLVLFSLFAAADENSNTSQDEFLKVNEAFKFSYQEIPNGFHLNFDIAEGYYLYKERFKLKPKALFTEADSIIFSTPGKAKNDPYFGLVHVFHDQLSVDLQLSGEAAASAQTINLSYQGCAEAGLCYPPVKQSLEYTPPALEQAKTTKQSNDILNTLDNTPATTSDLATLDSSSSISNFLGSSDLLTIVGIFFLLGIGLTFTPCVFPMIPIITAVIAGQDKPTASRSFMLALSYVLGMSVTYAAAGVATGLLGASANLQVAFQNPIFLSVIALIFIALSLSMFGLYEIQLPEGIRSKLNNQSQSLRGGHIMTVFAIGALSALVVSPCVSAPLAGALLYISSTGDALIGGLSLLALGLGMGVPLILIAVGGGKFLPRAGAWMERIKNVFGVLLLAIAIWLVSRIVSETAQLGIWASFFIILAVFMGAFDTAESGWKKFSKGLGLILFSMGAMLLIGLGSGSANILQPLDKLSQGAVIQSGSPLNQEALDFNTIHSLDELAQEIDKAQNQGLPVLVDVYADWCISCKVIEEEIFSDPAIKRTMQGFHLVKADMTENDAANVEFLESFELFGPPSILFYGLDGKELTSLRLVGEPSLETFAKHLNQVN